MSPDEATVLLARLGIEVTDSRGDELIALCPGHLDRTGREDGSPSWSFNAASGLHHCFSCGFKGGLLYLITFQVHLFTSDGSPDWGRAKDWLGSEEVDLGALMGRLEAAKSHAMPTVPVQMSEARLAIFDEPPTWALEARKITLAATQTYRVGWDPKSQSWITPIRDAVSGKLLGWQEKGQGSRYFRNRPAGVQKSLTLFGIERWTGPTMVVVESPLDVVRLTSLGLDGGVSTFGASVSKHQIDLMLQADRLVVAFDNDLAGKKASDFVLDQARKHGFECFFFNYDGVQAKDVGDMHDSDVYQGIRQAKHCVLGRSAIA